MGAPKGNQFWKLRSKHGRDRLFATADLLLQAAFEYFEWCENNPWTKTETTIGKNRNDIKTTPVERPFTLTGLCLYLGCNTKYFSDFKQALKENDKDFSEVVTRIEQIIYTQKFEGAAVGAFNPNIIARDLGLADKQDLNGSIIIKIDQEDKDA